MPACDGIDNRPESSIFTHVVDKVINEDKLIVVDTLYDHGHNIASNLSWTKIVLDHLLYLHDTYNYDNCYSTVSLRQQYQRAYVYYQQLYINCNFFIKMIINLVLKVWTAYVIYLQSWLKNKENWDGIWID